MTGSTQCERVEAFHDGELAADEADAFRLHLADCAACQGALRDLMMLVAAVHPHAEALTAPPLARVIPLPRARRRTSWMALAGVVAAAAAFALYYAMRPRPVVLALGPTRSLEARFAYGPAAGYRPYTVERAAGVKYAEIPLETLVRLERRGDLHGLGDAYALQGQLDRAAQLLERAPSSAAVDGDRAAVALGRGKLEEALKLSERALGGASSSGAALWNRALVLRDLALPLSAADTFDRVAALGEPGWSQEAKERASALRAAVQARANSWQTALDSGRGMVASRVLPGDAVVRAWPGLMRHFLYHALRSAW
jgi:tetratricopeptide (TPR) repeat protein